MPMSAFGVPCTESNDVGQGIQGTPGDDVICGLGGNDLIIGNGGADLIDGGGGIDRVGYQNAPGGVTVNLATGVVSGAAGNDRLANVEQVMDSPHADVLTGSSGSNYFWLHGGADTVDGGGGTDAVDYTYAAAGACADDTLTSIEETYPDGACT
jgi:Ca2+-binding RTX toxin-like protein